MKKGSLEEFWNDDHLEGMQEVTTGMREGELTTWIWSTEKGGKKNKIKTLDTERCENIKNLYILIYLYILKGYTKPHKNN